VNLRRSRFAPRPGPTVLTAAAIVLFVALGNWQLGRAEEKRELAAKFGGAGPAIDWRQLPPDAPRYTRVTLRGHYDPEHQFLLDNRSHESVAGVEVLTPFLLDNGSAVVVNRGWQPFGATRKELPGIWLKAPAAPGWPRLVQYPDMEDLSQQLGRKLSSHQVLLDPAVPDGYVRDWSLPGTPIDRHIGYAVQWFAFAALAGAIWFVLSFRKPSQPG
jgi:surfeit locus 1 family protein